MGDLVDAKNIFEIRKFINAKDLEGIQNYIEAEEYGRSISHSLMVNIIDAIDQSGFNITEKRMLDDLTFINMAINATLDRQLGVDNQFYQHIGKMIQKIKSEIK
tara:strand:- start:33244 stop:33555 length:312 start_codon:yes stop_codon:yes gene_type:complete